MESNPRPNDRFVIISSDSFSLWMHSGLSGAINDDDVDDDDVDDDDVDDATLTTRR